MIEDRLLKGLPSIAPEFQPVYDLSMVIPTRNEAGNIEPLLMRIHQALKGISAEVVFVDDSTDETPEVIRKLQEWFPLPIKLIHRPKEERKNGPGGDSSSLGFTRNLISHVFALTTRMAFPQRLWNVTDPLTGFFLTRRGALKVEDLKPDGFKILLEILVSHPHLKVSEVPIQFGHRHAGESKASLKETIKFFRGLYRLRMVGNENFLRFLLVGLTGLVVNSLALYAFTELVFIHYVI